MGHEHVGRDGEKDGNRSVTGQEGYSYDGGNKLTKEVAEQGNDDLQLRCKRKLDI